MAKPNKPNPEAILTTLLRRGSRGVDAPALAKEMLKRHGSLAPILESQVQDLVDAEGLNRSGAQLISLIPHLARYVRVQQAMPKGALTTLKQAGELLCALFMGFHYERVCLLCLDGNGKLLQAAQIHEGTVDETPFYLRNILETAARAGAEAVVLSHNHPGGTMHPSQPDVRTTLRAVKALSAVGVLVLDHVIVADGRAVSMHKDGPIERDVFLAQDPGSALLKGWLG